MNASEAPLVSVIVPMRNEERYIGRCLRSLAEQDYPPERLEALVVDGQSTDSSPAVVAEFARSAAFPVRLLDNPGLITSRALNRGLREARGEVICIASAHSRLGPSFISRGVGLLMGRGVECVSGPISSVGEGLVGGAVALAMSHPFGVGDARFRYSRREELVDQAAFALYRKDVFERVGEFDESMNGDTDTDFHYRLTELGGCILQSPQLECYYHVRPTLRSLFRQYFNYGFSKLTVMRRYPHRVKPRQLIPSLFVASLLASGGAATVSKEGRTLLAVLLGNYALVSLATSAAVASKVGWRYMPILPFAFACLHLGYGLGLLRAVSRWVLLGEEELRSRVE